MFMGVIRCSEAFTRDSQNRKKTMFGTRIGSDTVGLSVRERSESLPSWAESVSTLLLVRTIGRFESFVFFGFFEIVSIGLR
jgi:hypothetical protein